MELVRSIVGVSFALGPLVAVLILLNRRDRRAAQLRHTVVEQLALPELRGRMAVHIRCAICSGRSTVIAELLGGTPHEVWNVFTCLASSLPTHVRLLVHAVVDRRCTSQYTLETVTGRMSSDSTRLQLTTG
jgi:hypothetical protein